MEETDMAVVVSQGQNEIDEMKAKGLDIAPHRKRMVDEDLETKFKDPADPFRIVFVCAMWMTGFDAPACSTIYLDKPMRNHTLMQTIARANRVFGEKTSGLIVDYVGVFRNLQRALAIYGSGAGGTAAPGESPVMDKTELVAALKVRIEETVDFCAARGVSIDDLIAAKGFPYIALRDDAVEILIMPGIKADFVHRANDVNRLFKAILPDKAANEFGPYRTVLVNLAEKIGSETRTTDITAVMDEVEALLDRSVAAEAYLIHAAEEEGSGHIVDLSEIDFDALAATFNASTRKRTEAERLKALLQRKATTLVRLNPTRIDYMERLQALIDAYNAGSLNLEEFFRQLADLGKSMSEEEQRKVAENLTEEELAVFDLLTKPVVELTDKERAEVKAVARGLLEVLKQGRLVLDWRKRQTTRAGVRLTIETVLDRLPRVFTKELYREKVSRIYEHVYDSYWGEGQSVYAAVT